MPSTVIALLFLATAPIHLLPAILAVFLRCRGRAWVVAANMTIWFSLPLSSALRMPVQLGVIGALILWLLLLRVVLNRTSSISLDDGDARSIVVGRTDSAVLASPNKSLGRTGEG
jgi:hypothetical protein